MIKTGVLVGCPPPVVALVETVFRLFETVVLGLAVRVVPLLGFFLGRPRAPSPGVVLTHFSLEFLRSNFV